MTLDQLANLGEFVGGVAVLATLVYLAIQTQQVKRMSLSAAYDKGADAWRDVLQPLIDNVDLYRRGATDYTALPGNERHRFDMLMHQLFAFLENAYAKHRTRVIDPVEWERLEHLIRWYLASPGIEAWWRRDGGLYTTPFAAHVRGVLDGFADGSVERPDVRPTFAE